MLNCLQQNDSAVKPLFQCRCHNAGSLQERLLSTSLAFCQHIVYPSCCQDAAQMQAVMGDCRPNCIVIDEVDGATGGSEGYSAVHALVKAITGDTKKRGTPGKLPAAAGV